MTTKNKPNFRLGLATIVVPSIILMLIAIFFINERSKIICGGNQNAYNGQCYDKETSCSIDNGNGTKQREGDQFRYHIILNIETGKIINWIPPTEQQMIEYVDTMRE